MGKVILRMRDRVKEELTVILLEELTTDLLVVEIYFLYQRIHPNNKTVSFSASPLTFSTKIDASIVIFEHLKLIWLPFIISRSSLGDYILRSQSFECRNDHHSATFPSLHFLGGEKFKVTGSL